MTFEIGLGSDILETFERTHNKSSQPQRTCALRRAEARTRECRLHCARERATYIACTSQTLVVLAILRHQLPVTRLRRRVYQATHVRRNPEARGGANINARPLSACSSPYRLACSQCTDENDRKTVWLTPSDRNWEGASI